MQLQGVRIIIIILFFASKSFGQDVYRLKTVDSTSFLKYYYFEFKKGSKIYKVISKKKDTLTSESSCYINLEVKRNYNLNIEQLLFLQDKDSIIGTFYYEVIRMRFRKGNRQFGGNEPVYMCDAIFRDKISCECLVDRKKR